MPEAFGLPVTEVIAALRLATAPAGDHGPLDALLLTIRRDWEMIAHTRYPALDADTPDAIQTAFAKLLAPGTLDGLADPSRVGAWVRSVFVNTVIDLLRDRQRRGGSRDAEGTDEDPAALCDRLPASTPGPEDVARGHELSRLLERSPACSDAARLRWIEDLPEREIAVRLGTTRSAIATQLKRLRRRLRKDLGE